MDRWTYKDAGVDIGRADELVEYIKARVANTWKNIMLLGGFSSGLKIEGYKDPVLFMSTDGVGTKLKVAQAIGVHNTVGIDLVAMNVNDVITSGAKPFAFLDYIATGRIEVNVLKAVLDGILEGCTRAETPLVGGETAEMPDFYPDGVYDLAGFCVGLCEADSVLSGEDIGEGDLVLGIPSSGFHSNGYSLIRKVLKAKGIDYQEHVQDFGKTVAEVLLEPTRIYWKDIKKIRGSVRIKAMVHITGGGIRENLIRVLKDGRRAIIEKSGIPKNPIFDWVKSLGNIAEEEMYRTFNMGVGFMLVVSKEEASKVFNLLDDVFLCGRIERGKRDVILV